MGLLYLPIPTPTEQPALFSCLPGAEMLPALLQGLTSGAGHLCAPNWEQTRLVIV